MKSILSGYIANKQQGGVLIKNFDSVYDYKKEGGKWLATKKGSDKWFEITNKYKPAIEKLEAFKEAGFIHTDSVTSKIKELKGKSGEAKKEESKVVSPKPKVKEEPKPVVGKWKQEELDKAVSEAKSKQQEAGAKSRLAELDRKAAWLKRDEIVKGPNGTEARAKGFYDESRRLADANAKKPTDTDKKGGPDLMPMLKGTSRVLAAIGTGIAAPLDVAFGTDLTNPLGKYAYGSWFETPKPLSSFSPWTYLSDISKDNTSESRSPVFDLSTKVKKVEAPKKEPTYVKIYMPSKKPSKQQGGTLNQPEQPSKEEQDEFKLWIGDMVSSGHIKDTDINEGTIPQLFESYRSMKKKGKWKRKANVGLPTMKRGGTLSALMPHGRMHRYSHKSEELVKSRYGVDVTPKGIPVLSKDCDSGTCKYRQVAEIEGKEVIFDKPLVDKVMSLKSNLTQAGEVIYNALKNI